MKKMRKLFPAIVMLVVSAVMMVSSSYAWFSMNQEVTASGIQIEAKATGSLVISKAYGSGYATSVELDTESRTLAPCSYGKNNNAEGGYEYLSNTEGVDPNTGKIVSPDKVSYGQATSNGHYLDFVVYIASQGDAFTASKITAEVKFATSDYGQQAATVDFIIKEEVKGSISAYGSEYNMTHTADDEGTPNVNERNYACNYSDKSVTLALTGGKVPQLVDGAPVNENGVIVIVMRVYFDGEAGTNDKNYVNSADGNISTLGISVTFKAE